MTVLQLIILGVAFGAFALGRYSGYHDGYVKGRIAVRRYYESLERVSQWMQVISSQKQEQRFKIVEWTMDIPATICKEQPHYGVHTLKCQSQTIKLFTSDFLSSVWPYGFVTVGSVTFESAAYVARYIMKKRFGADKDAHYETINPNTGEIVGRKPEYTTMSRRPGIGSRWFDAHRVYTYEHDHVIVNGRAVKPPVYYDRLYEKIDPIDFQFIKDQRATQWLLCTIPTQKWRSKHTNGELKS